MDNKAYFILATVILFAVVGCAGIYYSLNKKEDAVPVKISVPVPSSATNEITAPASTTPAQDQSINNTKTMNTITLDTSMGKIVFTTYNDIAPKTAENFITLANKGFYNGVIFHRVIDGFMIQGGDPTGTGTGGPGYTIPDEFVPGSQVAKDGYKKGVVAMANTGQPNSGGSQFFIMLADYPLPYSYTIFGKVISGQEVVDAIGRVKTGASDKPFVPVVIDKVTVE